MGVDLRRKEEYKKDRLANQWQDIPDHELKKQEH